MRAGRSNAAGPHVALVTCAAFPEGTADDATLAGALRTRGATVSWHCWDNRAAPWRTFDLIALRSTWDYHTRLPEFAAWVTERQEGGQRLVNSPALVRWNMHKGYLQELVAGGVRIPASEMVHADDLRTLRGVMHDRGMAQAVVKPAVSASAYRTFRVSSTDADFERHEETFASMRRDGDVIVQEYLDAIVREGEWSAICFDGRLSHAVRKRARDGDFRVQSEFGGTATLEAPPRAVVEGADRVLRLLPECPAYARIDGCVTEAGFVLMEAELIEPSLFLRSAPQAAGLFADALLGRLG